VYIQSISCKKTSGGIKMKTKSYICRVCGKNNPCIVFVGEQDDAPSNCPYFQKKKFLNWIEEEIIFSTTIEV